MIVPNRETLKRHIKHDFSTIEGKQEAIQLILHDINKFRTGGIHSGMFPERWLPTTFAILSEPFTEQNRMINSTLKVARGEVESVYKETLNFLYTPEGKMITNNRNIVNIF